MLWSINLVFVLVVVELTRLLDAGRKSLGFSVSIEIDLVFVWVVDNELISVWGIELNLISVGGSNLP